MKKTMLLWPRPTQAIDDQGYFMDERVLTRYRQEVLELPPDEIDFMDVSPKQVFSVATSLIPFLEHDDASRALMGSNMQRQAVPLIKTEAPYVGTGLEYRSALDSGVITVAKESRACYPVSADEIMVETATNQRMFTGLKIHPFQPGNVLQSKAHCVKRADCRRRETFLQMALY